MSNRRMCCILPVCGSETFKNIGYSDTKVSNSSHAGQMLPAKSFHVTCESFNSQQKLLQSVCRVCAKTAWKLLCALLHQMPLRAQQPTAQAATHAAANAARWCVTINKISKIQLIFFEDESWTDPSCFFLLLLLFLAYWLPVLMSLPAAIYVVPSGVKRL